MNETRKITASQVKALQLINDNSNVIAVDRGIKGYLTINGNTENKLWTMELIEKLAAETRTHARFGNPTTWTVHVWRLTDAGREVLASLGK